MIGRDPAGSTSRSTSRSTRRAGQLDAIRDGAALVLVTLIVLLAVDNRQDVSVGWLVDDAEVPLFLLFITTFAMGIMVGFLLRVRRRHR